MPRGLGQLQDAGVGTGIGTRMTVLGQSQSFLITLFWGEKKEKNGVFDSVSAEHSTIAVFNKYSGGS